MGAFLFRQLAETVTIKGGGSIENVPRLDSGDVLHNALNITYGLAGIIAVIVIIIGGIMFATSAGNSGTVTKAKNMILYAVVGIVLVIGAYAVTNFVLTSFK